MNINITVFFKVICSIILLLTQAALVKATSPVVLEVKAVGSCKQLFNKRNGLKRKLSEPTSCNFKIVLKRPSEPTAEIISPEPLQVQIFSGTTKKSLSYQGVKLVRIDTGNFNGRTVKFNLLVPANKHFQIAAIFVPGDIYNPPVNFYYAEHKLDISICSDFEALFNKSLESGRSCKNDSDCMYGESYQSLSNGSCNCDDSLPLNVYADVGLLDMLIQEGLKRGCSYAKDFMLPEDTYSICMCNKQIYSCNQGYCSR